MDVTMDLAQQAGLVLPLAGVTDQLVKLLAASDVKALLYGEMFLPGPRRHTNERRRRRIGCNHYGAKLIVVLHHCRVVRILCDACRIAVGAADRAVVRQQHLCLGLGDLRFHARACDRLPASAASFHANPRVCRLCGILVASAIATCRRYSLARNFWISCSTT